MGVYQQDSLVQYIVNGLPVYAHGKDNLQGFRFFFSNLISHGLCTKAEVRKAFCIIDDYVNRYYRLFKAEGEAGFFKPENRHGYCHKLGGDNLVWAQQLLDDGLNQSARAAAVGVSESAIRYAIKMGYLKKSSCPKHSTLFSFRHRPYYYHTESFGRSLADKHTPLGIATTNMASRLIGNGWH